MSQIQSTLLSENPLIEGDSVTLPIVKVGTKAYSADGNEFTLTRCALESGAESWKGGIITVNHQIKEKGVISKAWFEDPFVYAKLDDLSDEAVEAINSAAYRGVSQESMPLEVHSGNVTKLKGSGVTLVFYPHRPACDQKMGCGIPIGSFNFPFYTQTSDQKVYSSGGNNLPDNEDMIIQLESTIKQKESLISTKDQEIDELKSKNAKLEEDLKAKDGQIASTVQAAVKAALESHDAEFMARQELDAAVKELASFMKEDTLKEFLNSKPSVEVIKSTASALKSSISKQVGAEGGETPESLLSIHDEWNAATGGEQ